MKRVDSPSYFNAADRTASRLSIADAVVVGQIGKSLASVYSNVLEEPLPERLAVLLKRVDETLRDRD